MQRTRRALGISVHTGWAACVVVGGSLARPVIDRREELELLGDAARFVFHMAEKMTLAAAEAWVARARAKALAAARRGLAALITPDLVACAIVASTARPGDLATVLAAHPRIHTAEGCLSRDVLLEALDLPTCVIAAKALDPKGPGVDEVGARVGRPWARDQKLAALAAWRVLAHGLVWLEPARGARV